MMNHTVGLELINKTSVVRPGTQGCATCTPVAAFLQSSFSNISAIKVKQGQVENSPPAPVSVCSPVRRTSDQLYTASLS